MKKWLIGLLILVLAGVGALWWLGTKAEANKPETGEIRIEVEDAL